MKNILLIGMPGAGKSTVGVILAKTLGYAFIDTDILLCGRIGSTLQEYIDKYGISEFLKAEESAALSIKCEKTVIATGGSMALSDAAMQHLKATAITVFLDFPLNEIKRRLSNIKTRGIALKPGQSIEDLFYQRHPVYKKYADITVPASKIPDPDIEYIVQEVLQSLKAYIY